MRDDEEEMVAAKKKKGPGCAGSDIRVHTCMAQREARRKGQWRVGSSSEGSSLRQHGA